MTCLEGKSIGPVSRYETEGITELSMNFWPRPEAYISHFYREML
jgi:hypothetical protein